jgi:hypothetical protein
MEAASPAPGLQWSAAGALAERDVVGFAKIVLLLLLIRERVFVCVMDEYGADGGDGDGTSYDK